MSSKAEPAQPVFPNLFAMNEAPKITFPALRSLLLIIMFTVQETVEHLVAHRFTATLPIARQKSRKIFREISGIFRGI